ncbi:MAG: MarC family protein [Bacteroidetes bacterium]|nr:MarC family protein [Bacteroidota bacterium]
MGFYQDFLYCFIPLFVAIDVFGVLPIFVGFTGGMEKIGRRKLVFEASLAALAVSVLFLIAGKEIFGFLGITLSDFRIGGGIILLVLSVNDLLFAHEQQRKDPGGSVGVVPIGIPLIMGPAALTTILILVNSYGYILVTLSLAVNLTIVYLVFNYSDIVTRLLGNAGSRVFSKVASLFLAAIAVMMIRVGITDVISKH